MFQTDNIYLAAYLILAGYKVKDIILKGRMGEFHFDSEVPVDVINDFFLAKTFVEPLRYMQATRQLTTAANRIRDRFNNTNRR